MLHVDLEVLLLHICVNFFDLHVKLEKYFLFKYVFNVLFLYVEFENHGLHVSWKFFSYRCSL